MKKLLISLIILCSVLISSFAYGEISKQQAEEYLSQNVCIIRDDFVTLYTIYGIVVDVFEYENEWHLLLKMSYRDQKEMIIKLRDILRIRRRLPNE